MKKMFQNSQHPFFPIKMKKENYGVKKLKLEDYEIGRILGKGNYYH